MFCDKREDDALCCWESRIKQRREANIGVVSVEIRLAKLAWVLLQKREMSRAMLI
ncbi:MAG: hypothetical protein ACJAYF_000956 [Arenicella sp.]|jgi:hypothetical protein